MIHLLNNLNNMNICIISTPRSGSTYLVKLLQQSPEISHFIDEPFNPDNITVDYTLGCEEHLHKIQAMSMHDNVLIKDNENTRIPSLYPHNNKLQNVIKEYEKLLKEKFYLIKLTRDNLFEQTLSSCIAPLNNIWVRNFDTEFPTTVNINVDTFKQLYFEFKLRNELLNSYAGCQKIIRYEDITGDSRTDWNLISGISSPDNYAIINNLRNFEKHLVVKNYVELQQLYEQFK